MYEKTEWRDGWLWIQSTPDGEFVRATERQMIDRLLDENQRLKDTIAAIKDLADHTKID